MNDIASSLEQEFTTHAQADRDAHIAALEKIEAAGRGSLNITPHAIALPLLFGACGGFLIYFSVTSAGRLSTTETLALLALGAALLLPSLWGMLGPRKPCYTLCEEGIRVKDSLLPWSSLEDWGITGMDYGGFPIYTTLTLNHVEGYTPPPLGLFRLFGTSRQIRKTGRYETYLTLHTGARGMNMEKLTQRIGDFFAAWQARLELARLG